MPNGSIADDGFALNDLSDDIDFIVREKHTNTFANGCRIAADRDKLSVATHADGDVAREAQDALCT